MTNSKRSERDDIAHPGNEPSLREGIDIPFGPPPEEYVYRCGICGLEDLVVRIQRIVDTRCIQRIVDIVVKCIQRIVDIGPTHLNLGGELCPVQLGLIIKTPNFAEPP